jgi:hypothetical protein
MQEKNLKMDKVQIGDKSSVFEGIFRVWEICQSINLNHPKGLDK